MVDQQLKKKHTQIEIFTPYLMRRKWFGLDFFFRNETNSIEPVLHASIRNVYYLVSSITKFFFSSLVSINICRQWNLKKKLLATFGFTERKKTNSKFKNLFNVVFDYELIPHQTIKHLFMVILDLSLCFHWIDPIQKRDTTKHRRWQQRHWRLYLATMEASTATTQNSGRHRWHFDIFIVKLTSCCSEMLNLKRGEKTQTSPKRRNHLF